MADQQQKSRSETECFFVGVLGITPNRDSEYQTLVRGESTGQDNLSPASAALHGSDRRPIPLQRLTVSGGDASILSYASFNDLQNALRLFDSRGFVALPFCVSPPNEKEISWKWRLLELKEPLPAAAEVLRRLPRELSQTSLLIPAAGETSIRYIAVYESGDASVATLDKLKAALQPAVQVLHEDSSRLSLEKLGESYVDQMIRAFESRRPNPPPAQAGPTYAAVDLLKHRIMGAREIISAAEGSGYDSGISLKLVNTPSRSAFPDFQTRSFGSSVWNGNSGNIPFPPVDRATLGGPSSFQLPPELVALGQTPEEIASKLAAVMGPEQRKSFADWSKFNPQESLEAFGDYVRRISLVTPSPHDKAATVAKIVDLIREFPAREISLTQLPGLYLARYRIPLNAAILGYPTLKSFILSVPELCLVWVYEPPPSPELNALRQVLRLDRPNSPVKHLDSQASAKLQILLQMDSGNDDKNYGLPSQVYVQERLPTVSSVGKDVLVAVVAHWVMIHQAQPGLKPSGSLSAALGTLSPIGMTLSLLARTWKANWSNICPLESLLRRSGFNDLEIFVRTIPQFIVKEEATAPPPPIGQKACYQESNIVIYLRQSARIPIIPELLPDPTTAAFSAPGQPTGANAAALVFFPPLLPQPTGGESIPSPPPPPERRRASEASGQPRVQRARVGSEPFRNMISWNQVLEMTYELIAVNCEWQRLRWEDGEDLLELREQAEDAELEREGADGLAEKAKKKEEREERRRKRQSLRELCRAKREGEENPSVSSESLDKFLAQMSPEELAEKRQKLRNRCVGVFVSSIKMEWSKYFEDCFPLTYFMEFFRIKKLKQLLCDTPNLILTGDGGFMRVCTVEHAKLLCKPFPPEGLSADGKQTIPCQFTTSSNALRFCCSTYISAMPEAERRALRSKSVFARKLSSANTQSDRRPSLSKLSTTQTSRQRRSFSGPFPSLTAVWEMSRSKAIDATGAMIVDLVRYCCSRQRDEAAKGDAANREMIELANPERLTPAQKSAFKACQDLGIDGLRLADIPNRWNYSFVLFSPFSSFVKKAGFDNISDPAFLNLLQSLCRDIFLVTTKDGVDILFPMTLDFLSDPQYFRPPDTSSGAWMKRKSVAYLSSDYTSRRVSGARPLIQPGYPVTDVQQ